MQQVQMIHPTMSFNGKPPGEPFTTNEDDVEYLVETYGCELADGSVDEDEIGDVILEEIEDGVFELVEDVPAPVKLKGGWYEWEDKKYRLADLPAEAREMLE